MNAETMIQYQIMGIRWTIESLNTMLRNMLTRHEPQSTEHKYLSSILERTEGLDRFVRDSYGGT